MKIINKLREWCGTNHEEDSNNADRQEKSTKKKSVPIIKTAALISAIAIANLFFCGGFCRNPWEPLPNPLDPDDPLHCFNNNQ